jgi:hypothetical protein
MKLVSILLLLVGLTPVLCAQEFEYPEGVYMSWDEVKLKSPSQHFQVLVEERSNTDIATNGGNQYKVVPVDSVPKKTIKQKIWAVSDGKDLYLNGYPFNIQSSYMKAEHIGTRVIIVQGVARNEDVPGIAGGLVVAMIVGSKRPIYRIGKTSGRTQKLDKQTIEKELENDPEILAMFQAEKHQGDAQTILKYAIIINSNHR